MSTWPSTKARKVLAALKSIGWRHDRQEGSHIILVRDGWAEYTWAFHEGVEIGPKMLSKISKKTGLKPSDL
ncbi:MAG: type II toxin-antitoxin system HicA family toxin [Polyangiaceae bacterium]